MSALILVALCPLRPGALITFSVLLTTPWWDIISSILQMKKLAFRKRTELRSGEAVRASLGKRTRMWGPLDSGSACLLPWTVRAVGLPQELAALHLSPTAQQMASSTIAWRPSTWWMLEWTVTFHGAAGKHDKWKGKAANLIIGYDYRYAKHTLRPWKRDYKRYISMLVVAQFGMFSQKCLWSGFYFFITTKASHNLKCTQEVHRHRTVTHTRSFARK